MKRHQNAGTAVLVLSLALLLMAVPQDSLAQRPYGPPLVLPTDLSIGESVTIRVTLQNNSTVATSNGGFLDVSNPNSSKLDMEIVRTSNDWDDVQLYPAGSQIYHREDRWITSVHPLISGAAQSWAGYQMRWIEIKFTARVAGTAYIYYRRTLNDYITPSSSAYTDQQGWPVDRAACTVMAFPDLVVSSAAIDRTSVAAGSSISVTCNVRNQGDATAASSRVGYYLSNQAGDLDTRIDYDPVDALATGASNSESATLVIPATATPGSYFIDFQADYADVVDENGDEDNNCRSVALMVTAPPTYTVSGRIVSTLNSFDIIPEAMVTIAGRSDSTDWLGYYSIAGVPAGTHVPTVTHPAYTINNPNEELVVSSNTTRNYTGYGKAAAEISVHHDTDYTPEGGPVSITVTLRNTSVAVSGTAAYLDVSFPDIPSASGRVAVVSATGWTNGPSFINNGDLMCVANTSTRGWTCLTPAQHLLTTAELTGNLAVNQNWSYTLTVTPPAGGNLRFRVKGSIGDRRYPAGSLAPGLVIGQQNILEQEFVIPEHLAYKVSGVVSSSLNSYDRIPNVTVAIPGYPPATTDWRGYYEIPDVTPGVHTIAVTGTAYEWNDGGAYSITVADDSTRDFLGSCKATAAIDVQVQPYYESGQPFQVTATLRNTGVGVDGVRAFLDVSFPDFPSASGVVEFVAQTGFDAPPQFFDANAEPICRVNRTTGVMNCDDPADYLLVTAEQSATNGAAGEWTYTLRIIPPSTGDIRLHIKGSIGDRRDPFEGSADNLIVGQQGLWEREVTIPRLDPPEIQYGTTIIVHGQALLGFGAQKVWMLDLAESIAVRCGGNARILTYQADTGRFIQEPGTYSNPDGETIILFNWALDTLPPTDGFSGAASDALFAALMSAGNLPAANQDHLDLSNFHFIGHSRGCAVVSETVERLVVAGRYVDHVTYLDPHDFGYDIEGHVQAGWTDREVNHFDVSFPAQYATRPGVVSWAGVGFVDTYWQDATGSARVTEDDWQTFIEAMYEAGQDGRSFEDFIVSLPQATSDAFIELSLTDLGGRPVQGAANLHVPEQPTIGHSVYRWYKATIDDCAECPAGERWFDTEGPDGYIPAATQTGYNYSRIARSLIRDPDGIPSRPDMMADGPQSPPEWNFRWTSGIYNGGIDDRCLDPQYALLYQTLRLLTPGWDFHGGVGSGSIVTAAYTNDIRLSPDLLLITRARHNRFYIPSDAVAIEFAYKATCNLTLLGNTKILVKIDGETVQTITHQYPIIPDVAAWVQVPIPPARLGTMATLEFDVQMLGTHQLFHGVVIDEVGLVMAATVSARPHTPIAVDPSDGAAPSSREPVLVWSGYLDGGDDQPQSGFQVRIRETTSDEIVYDTGFIADTESRTHRVQPAGTYSGFDMIAGNERMSMNLQWGTEYHWHVRYRDSGGDWSAWSADIMGGQQHFTPADPTPTFLSYSTLELTGGSAHLEWAVMSTKDPVAFDVVRISGNIAHSLPQLPVCDDNIWRLVDNGLRAGQTYVYQVYCSEGGQRSHLFESKALTVPLVNVELFQNSPNPFNPTTRIEFSAPAGDFVRLTVYDTGGRKVRRLFDAQSPAQGHAFAIWDGRDDAGRQVPAGIYFCSLETAGATRTKRMVLVK